MCNQSAQKFENCQNFVFTSNTGGNRQVGLIVEDAVDHSGTGRVGAHFQKNVDAVLIGLLDQGRKIKTRSCLF